MYALSTIHVAWTGLYLGLVYCAAPGAVNVMALEAGLETGVAATLGIETGSIIGDAVYGAVALAGLSFLLMRPGAHLVLALAGFVLLAYLGWSAIRTGWRAGRSVSPGRAKRATGSFMGAFGVGMAMSLANPWGVAFWMSLGGAALAQLGHPSFGDTELLFVSYLAGAFLWTVLYTIGIGLLRRVFRPHWLGYFGWFSGLALWGFAVNLLVGLVR